MSFVSIPDISTVEVHEDFPPLFFVVWIDTWCGHFAEPDWEIDGPLGREVEPLDQALVHAARVRSMGYPALLVLPGQTPRLDGLFENPRFS